MHQYIAILIHYKIKRNLSILLIIFIIRWKIFVFNNFIVFIHVHIFSNWDRMPIDFNKYKYKQLVSTCHQSLLTILCWGANLPALSLTWRCQWLVRSVVVLPKEKKRHKFCCNYPCNCYCVIFV
jgi:hypothetical protein